MNQSAEELLKEIALKHGVVVGKNDPIMILHTLNEKLAEESIRAQQKLLEAFKSETELMLSRIHSESKLTAERLVLSVIDANLKSTNIALNENTVNTVKKLQDAIDEAVEAQIAKIKLSSYLNLTASFITCFSALTLAVLLILNK